MSNSKVASAAEAPDSLELQVKAALVYNFAKFVEWPESAGKRRTLTFCFFGAEALFAEFGRNIDGKSINAHTLAALQVTIPIEAQRCQIAFIGATEKRQVDAHLDAMASGLILTISEFDQFARRGGMIELIKEANKLRFIINVDALTLNGLRISSKLLQLARVVHQSGESRKP